METIQKNYVLLAIRMFKSYYVVWKLTAKQKLEGLQNMFKSYYVVWKLII